MRKNIFACFMSAAAAMGSGGFSENSSMNVSSVSFQDNDYLDAEYSCEGRDLSPEIHWKFHGKAESYALICEDPDAPGGTFSHWVVYNIPGSYVNLAKGFPKSGVPDGIIQGRNDFGETGYNGPCPPKGKVHHYIFTVYALSVRIDDRNLTAAELKKAMKGHVKGSASFTGLFKRQA